MTIYNRSQNGLWVPKEKPQPQPRRLQPKEKWNCPSCGYFYDPKVEGPREEYTVGSLLDEYIPHIRCPKCKECMGCLHGT